MRKYLRAANVGWSGLLLDDVKEMNFTDEEMKVFRLAAGDILLNEASGSPKEVGKPALWNGEIKNCAFQNTLLRVRPSSDTEPRYLLHYFAYQATTGEFARGSRGVGINHLGREALSRWSIPFPPLDEQRRIAAILDKADTLRIARRAAVTQLKQLNLSLFRSMFSSTMARTRTVLLGDLITDAQLGLVRGSKDIGPDRCHPYVRMDAITPTGDFAPRDADRTEASDADLCKYSAHEGDLLFNTRNTRELVGKSAIFRGTPRLFNNNILRLRFQEDAALASYIHGFLWSPIGLQELERRKSGTTSVFAIYGKHLATTPIPLPPLDTQVAYAEALNAISSRASLAFAQEHELDQLFASLQSRAFRGEL
jgi:type I restriction enzyme S subunit